MISVGCSHWGRGTDRLHPHGSTALVALRTISGGGVLVLVKEGRRYRVEIKDPSVILFNDAHLYRVTEVSDHWDSYWYEFVSPESLPLPPERIIPTEVTAKELATAKSIQEGITSERFSERAYATARFASLLYSWYREEDYELDPSSLDLMEKAVAVLRTRIYEPTSVESVATSLGVHPVKLRRLFREHMNMSPKQYFDRIRIEESRRMLQRGLLAKQVAAKLGFHSTKHYGRVFKEQVGLTIREYRQRYGEPDDK